MWRTAITPVISHSSMGRLTFSRPQRFVANYSYDLPLGTHTGAMQKLLGGWNVSGVTVIQGGAPITIADSTAGTLFGTSGASQAGFGRVELAPGTTVCKYRHPRWR